MDFNNIMIGSEDPQRLVDYYLKLLGKPSMEDGGYTGWQIGSGWLTVGPHSEVHGKNEQPGRLLWNIESADVRGDFDRLGRRRNGHSRAVRAGRGRRTGDHRHPGGP